MSMPPGHVAAEVVAAIIASQTTPGRAPQGASATTSCNRPQGRKPRRCIRSARIGDGSGLSERVPGERRAHRRLDGRL